MNVLGLPADQHIRLYLIIYVYTYIYIPVHMYTYMTVYVHNFPHHLTVRLPVLMLIRPVTIDGMPGC